MSDNTLKTGKQGDQEPDQEAIPLLKEMQQRINSSTDKWEQPFKEIRRLRRYISGRRTKSAYEGNINEDLSTRQDMQANIVYATIQGILPHLYAKNPQIDVRPTENVNPSTESYEQAGLFSDTLEIVTNKSLKMAGLKQLAKQSIREAQISSVAVAKVGYQTDYYRDPIIAKRIEDLQAKLAGVRGTAQELDDPDADEEEKEATAEYMKDQVEALQQKVEVMRAEGLVIDPLPVEDFRMDPHIDTLYRYREAKWMSQANWLTKKELRDMFAADDEQIKELNVYKRNAAGIPQKMGAKLEAGADQPEDLSHNPEVYLIWELWDRGSNSVYSWGEGGQNWLRDPWQPERMGERWYPFFLLGFNWLGSSEEWPISDVALLENLGIEYDTIRKQAYEHRKLSKPHYLTDSSRVTDAADLKRFTIAGLGEVTCINAAGTPVGDMIVAAEPPPYNPAIYDTTPIRSDMEWVSGLGDAQRGGVQRAKTATEANIQDEGMSARIEEKRDSLEDWIGDMAKFSAEMLIQSMSLETVKRIAGEGAYWPMMSKEELYTLVEVEIRAGSTGKPNKMKELDTWISLMPELKENIQFIMQLRAEGVPDDDNPYVQLLLETLKRTDENINLEKFLPGEPVQREEPMNGEMGPQSGSGQVGPQGATPDEMAQAGGPQEGAPTAGQSGLPPELEAQMAAEEAQFNQQANQTKMQGEQQKQMAAGQKAQMDGMSAQMKMQHAQESHELDMASKQQKMQIEGAKGAADIKAKNQPKG